MPKGKHHQNPQAAEFTDYTIAGTKQGQVHAAISRAVYQQGRDYIRTGRSLRRICRATTVKPRITAQAAKRYGYPTKRERDDNIPSHRGVPHSNFLRRFKIVERLVGTGMGDLVWVAKVYVLHATRGWKLYA